MRLMHLLLASLLGTAVPLARGQGDSAPPPVRRHAKVSMHVQIPNPVGSKYLKLWVPYPVSDDSQTVENVQIAGNYQRQGVYREREFGNTALFLRWLQAEGNATLEFSFEVKREERLVRDFSGAHDAPPSILTQPFLDLDPAVRLALSELTASLPVEGLTALERARVVYDYIVDNFERDPKIVGCGTGDVPEFLNARKGKCADFSSTFIALARSVGVPAREVYGLRLSKEAEDDISDDYHCWAEFFVSGVGWVPADPSDVVKFARVNALSLDDARVVAKRDYYFGGVDEHRVRLGTGNQIRLAPLQLLDPLAYFMCPYLEVGYESNCEGADLKKMNLRGLTFTASCLPIVERRSLIGVGEMAPQFITETLSGDTYSLTPAPRRDYTILSFFATW
ncbi:MAG: transglutaminase domain-containing protein [Planctomycetota bacterium]|nr:transglutaminase [Psychrobacter sp.]MDP6385768.1 transglutaminase domain-containing protein [Planctomycetota bacterium]MDP6740176.1 transglutaminase domain-containing protein [Planctomycetota bacterium]MDP6939891.1 transglutaminase domain-containing protein [Planctomycetota bacterium]